MPRFIGRLLDVGLGKETTRGRAVAPVQWLAKTSSDFEDKADYARVTGSHGNINQIAGDYRVSNKSEGNIEGEIDADAQGYLLLSALGASTPVSKGGADAAVYDHTFTLDNTNQHDTLTIVYKDPNLERRFAGCLVDSLKYSVEPGGLATFAAGFKGKHSSATTGNTASYGTKYYFPQQTFVLKTAAAAAGLAAADQICVKSATFTIEQNADFVPCLGSIQPRDVLNKGYFVHGTFVLDHQGSTYRELFKDGTSYALRWQLLDTETVIGATAHPGLVFDLNKVYFEGWETDTSLEEIASETVEWVASLDENQELFNSIILTNLTTAY